VEISWKKFACFFQHACSISRFLWYREALDLFHFLEYFWHTLFLYFETHVSWHKIRKKHLCRSGLSRKIL
jgi:hypothetical protein